VYIAPDGFHMGIENGARVWLSAGEPENGMRPSVSFLFRSAADFYGKNAAGILLSGMGKDGAKELKIMKDMGCMTMVQDRESSPVYGMPGAAIECDAANYVLPPEGIAHALAGMVSPGQPEYEIL
jgi:two-component system chemotaxis response regulator CheB